MLSAHIAVLTDPERLAHEATRVFGGVEPAKDTSEMERAITVIEDKQRRLMQAMLDTDLPQNLLRSQATQLSGEKRRLETELAGARIERPAMDVAAIRSAIPEMADYVRSWVEQARDEDLALLLRVLDVRVTASKERAVIEATALLSRLVQILNLATIERTSA